MRILNGRFSTILLVLITAIVGVGLIIYSIHLISTTKEKKSNYISTEAVIIGYEKVESSDDTTYRFIAEYEVDGKKYTIVPRTSTSMNLQPKKGDVVLVRYNPNSPEEAILDKDNTWVMTMVFGIVCLIVAGIFAIIIRGRIL